jgi:uroporphyrinogen decarboxylase
MFEHREADRVPIIDSPWGATMERWRREGLPEGVDWVDYFGVDRTVAVGGNMGPRLERRTIEETDEYKVFTTDWGATVKDFKHSATVPEQIDFTVKDRATWRALKPRLAPSRDRVNWDRLEQDYRRWREQGCWITGGLFFGFDVTHARVVGTERFLIALATDPDWCTDIFDTQCRLSLSVLEMIWDAGYTFDAIRWPDDMGYKYSQFFSMDMYREVLKPFHRRAIEWAHARGIKAELHSCGDIRPFIPEFVEMGLDALNPLEVKAGVDPLAVKAEYGDQLVIHGGINALLWDKPDEIRTEIKRAVPALKQNGGYIFSSDHSIPSSVSLEDMRGVVDLIKDVGRYG